MAGGIVGSDWAGSDTGSDAGSGASAGAGAGVGSELEDVGSFGST